MFSERENARRRLERLAWYLDSAIPIPGLKYRVGIDPLIGLLPWVGDAIGAVISSYIISEAARVGAPKSVLLKMISNVIMDAIIGGVPVVGDLFDFGWKANQRNFRLLEHFLERPRRTVVSSRLFLVMLILLLVLFMAFIGFIVFSLFHMAWRGITGA